MSHSTGLRIKGPWVVQSPIPAPVAASPERARLPPNMTQVPVSRPPGDVKEPGSRSLWSELVCRAAYAQQAAVQNVGVDHRRRDVLVNEQLLHRADLLTIL